MTTTRNQFFTYGYEHDIFNPELYKIRIVNLVALIVRNFRKKITAYCENVITCALLSFIRAAWTSLIYFIRSSYSTNLSIPPGTRLTTELSLKTWWLAIQQTLAYRARCHYTQVREFYDTKTSE